MSTIEKALAKQKKAIKTDNSVVKEPITATDKIVTPSNHDIDDVERQVVVTENVSKQHKQLIIDKNDLEQRGYLIDSGSRKSIKDEFRQIKRKLLSNAFGPAAKTLNNPNLIMISSARPNEGKTFVAINLALSIALEKDKSVLLIDTDVLRPSVSRELGIEQTSGLIEYLLGEEKDPSDVIFDTNIDNLKLIPAGEPHHLSNELLASEKMATLAQELANRYPDRVVIFDCPPLLGITETLVLANFMGQALIVVEESKTYIEDVKKATKNLNDDLAVGLVLNKAIRSHKDMYGYYGYGYHPKT
jgi:protein-tyrosine kinase